MRLDRALILVFAFTLLVRWLGQDVIVPTFGFAAAAAFFLPVYVALVWLGVVRWAGVGLGELGWRWRWQDVAWGVLGLLLLSAWILPWTGAAPDEWLELATRYPPHARARFVVIGLTAAFLEETFFRGCLQSALARYGTAVAIV